jgi:aconitase B
LAASREHRIKTLEQLNEAMEEEDDHFRSSLEEFIEWFRSNGLNLGKKVELHGKIAGFRELSPDADATYEKTVMISAKELKPTIACPHQVDNTKTIDEIGDVPGTIHHSGEAPEGRSGEDLQKDTNNFHN